jgi:methylated-DNA-[protein]-cysteine S-methyltransferase
VRQSHVVAARCVFKTAPTREETTMGSTTPAAEVWHTVTPTAIGALTVVRDAQAIRGLYFPHHWYRPDPATFGPRSDDGFADVIAQLGQYLDGRRRVFDLPLAARGDARQRQVWGLIQEIGYGRTATYGDLAARLGDGVTAQEVGATVGRNPLSILIPCHRVVGKGGKLTGYAGGIERKRQLLELEAEHTTDAPRQLVLATIDAG